MKGTRNYLSLLKRALPIMAFVGAGLMAACEKPTPTPEPEPEPAPVDPVKVLKFGNIIGIDSISYENIMKYANNPHISTIIYFMDSVDDNNNYAGYTSRNISILRKRLQERLDYTPKATGGGTFIFWPNHASVEDSLWYVANGWQIRIYGR